MKCPIDQTEMEKGMLSNSGASWINGMGAQVQRIISFGMANINAYRCPKCGKIELTTEVKDENK